MKIALLNTNRTAWLALLAAGALVSGCSTSRMASGVEYDDVYVTQSDIRAEREARLKAEADARSAYHEPTIPAYEDYGHSQQGRVEPYRPQSFAQEFYDDDDFVYSRRVRRFDSPSRNNWRYYDPYFSNDLYFVMGSPAWPRWYNSGWYNWNYPRFGTNWMWMNSGFGPGFGMGWNNPNAFNSWGWGAGFNSGFYNPWMDAYYGISPWGMNPWMMNSWGMNPWMMNSMGMNPWGMGYYQPGMAFSPYTAGGFAARDQRFVSSMPRQSAMSSMSQTSYREGNAAVRPATAPTTGTTGRASELASSNARTSNVNDQYLRPRTAAEMPSRTSSQAPARQFGTPTNAGERQTYPATPARSGVQPGRDVPSGQPSNLRPSTPSTPDRRVEPSTPATRPSNPSPSTRPASPSRPQPSYDRPSTPSRPSYERPSSPAPRSSFPSYSPSSGGGGGGSARPSTGGSPAPRRP